MRHVHDVLQSQFGAAMEMLRRAMERCPPDLWDERSEGPPFWHLAYHTLFYLDLYLSESEAKFCPPAFHLPNANFLREMPFAPYRVETPEAAFAREQLLEYLEHASAKAKQAIESLTEERSRTVSPFPWLPFTVGELMLYNLRHVQHHVGQLNLILCRRSGTPVGWIGSSGSAPMDSGSEER